MIFTIVVTHLKIMVTILVTPFENVSQNTSLKVKISESKAGTRTEGRVAPRSSSSTQKDTSYNTFNLRL